MLVLCLLCSLNLVENGLKPKGPARTIRLQEDLRVTPSRGDEYLWTGPNVGVDALADGRMIVVDDRENRLVLLDVNGQFIRIVGGTGEGPGEFQSLRSFQILQNQQGLAFDHQGPSSSLSTFDAGLEFGDRRHVSAKGVILRSLNFSGDSRWCWGVASSIDVTRNVEITQVLLMNDRFEVQEELLNWETMTLDPTKISDGNHWVKFLSERLGVLSLGKDAFVAFAPDGSIYSARADAYDILKQDAGMEPIMRITKKYQPITFTEEEVAALVDPVHEAILSQLPTQLQEIVTKGVVRRATEAAEFPRVKWPIAGLRAMEDSQLLVIHNADARTGVATAHLFDRSGKFVGAFDQPHKALNTIVFKNGFAYAIEEVDGDRHLVRYQIKIET